MSDGEPKKPGDYEVGYGKPPLHGRITPGEVRNPRGRPKGVRNLRTDFKEALAEPITVKVNGAHKRMTSQRALIKSMVVSAVKGDARAQAKTVDLSLRLFGEEADATDVTKLAEQDQAIIDAFMARMQLDDPTSAS